MRIREKYAIPRMALSAMECPAVSSGTDTYVLGTNEQGRQNLDQQHQLMAKASYEQLLKAGLKAGQVVWDIGCGSGAMTEYLAKKVGDEGSVFAVDASQEQLENTRKRLSEAGFKNVTFIRADIQDVKDWPVEQADIVYSRFVFMHLTDPHKALIQMKSLLKPGGVLSLQESAFSANYASDNNPIIKHYLDALLNLGISKGVDYDIGKKLSKLCHDVGFQNIDAYEIDHRYNAREAKLLMLGRLDEMKEKFIAANLADEQKVHEWREAMTSFPEQDQSFYFSSRQYHVLAWKTD